MGATGGKKRSKYRMPARDHTPPPDYSMPDRYTFEGQIASGWRFIGGLKHAPLWARITVWLFAAGTFAIIIAGIVGAFVKASTG